MDEPRIVQIIAVPYDSGRRDFRLGRGPARLIELGLLDALRNAGCDVEVQEISLPTDGFTPDTRVAVDLQAAIAERVADARRRGAFPLVLAGNCGTSVGTVAGVTATGSHPVVFWFDAHGDLNTPETTTTGFLDGMALAMLTGRCWGAILARVPGFSPVPDGDVTLIAARDIDPPEQALIDGSAIRHIAANGERDAFDVRTLEMSLHAARGREAYVHLDLDALDPSEGRANSYAAPGGMSRRDVLAALKAIGDGVALGAAAITAYDPETDRAGSIARIAIDAAAQLVTARSPVTLPANRSMPPGRVIPVLGYGDVRAAAAWLCRAFGFAERLRIAEHRVQLVTDREGELGSVVVAEQGVGSVPVGETAMPGHSVMVRVADVDAHATQALAAGARIVSPPTTFPFGERQYTVEDLGGHRWTFTQSVADIDPASWGGELMP